MLNIRNAVRFAALSSRESQVDYLFGDLFSRMLFPLLAKRLGKRLAESHCLHVFVDCGQLNCEFLRHHTP